MQSAPRHAQGDRQRRQHHLRPVLPQRPQRAWQGSPTWSMNSACLVVGPARAVARKALGWPKICKLAHAFLREHSHERLQLAQFLGQLGVFLTRWVGVFLTRTRTNRARRTSKRRCARASSRPSPAARTSPPPPHTPPFRPLDPCSGTANLRGNLYGGCYFNVDPRTWTKRLELSASAGPHPWVIWPPRAALRRVRATGVSENIVKPCGCDCCAVRLLCCHVRL